MAFVEFSGCGVFFSEELETDGDSHEWVPESHVDPVSPAVPVRGQCFDVGAGALEAEDKVRERDGVDVLHEVVFAIGIQRKRRAVRISIQKEMGAGRKTQDVGCCNDDRTAGFGHANQLADELEVVLDVLDYFNRDHTIEESVRQRDAFAEVGLVKWNIRTFEVVFEEVAGLDSVSHVLELAGEVAFTGANVQYACLARGRNEVQDLAVDVGLERDELWYFVSHVKRFFNKPTVDFLGVGSRWQYVSYLSTVCQGRRISFS